MENWRLLLSFFPENWIEMAYSSGAIKGLRKNKDVENYIRMLLIHIADGYSLRETAARAKRLGLADISDVALLGRLKKAKKWLHRLCAALFEEQKIDLAVTNGFQVRLFDAANVTEPGKTGSIWRIHYSVQLPCLTCDFFKLSATKGKGTGKSFFQYSIKKGDYIIADKGYSTASGIDHAASKKAFLMVELNTQALSILNLNGQPFSLTKNLQSIEKAGSVKSWRILIPGRKDNCVKGRICVIRKSNAAIKIAQKKIKNETKRKRRSLKPEMLEYAKYVIIFTNFPQTGFSDFQVLDSYRAKWQMERVFNRFKSIAQTGHLPKHNDDSFKAWLYGKLFVALLTNKLIDNASTISPWGYSIEEHATTAPLPQV
ncbi:MAG: transposase [Desulfobacteraceae bacterium]|nr:transposase [Desulfobacteraceae bacterium]